MTFEGPFFQSQTALPSVGGARRRAIEGGAGGLVLLVAGFMTSA
jgi:hypothetical protein